MYVLVQRVQEGQVKVEGRVRDIFPSSQRCSPRAVTVETLAISLAL